MQKGLYWVQRPVGAALVAARLAGRIDADNHPKFITNNRVKIARITGNTCKSTGRGQGSLKLLLNPALRQIMVGLLKVEKNN
jgi:hypothetical protein